MILLQFHYNSVETAEGPGLDSNTIAYCQKWPGLNRATGGDQGLDGPHLDVIDGCRNPVVPDNLDYSWGLQNRKPVLGIESAKKIPGKQGGLGDFDPV